jgi:tetratricopeptide (TPR) repeat protein
MRDCIHPYLFSKNKTYTLVSMLVCLSLQVPTVYAWPAVLPQANSSKKPQDKIETSSKSGESRISKGFQKTLAEGHYRLGLRLKKKKQWEEALTQFLESTNKNPNHFKSFFEQALIYRQKQIHDMAVTCLEQALTIKPKYKDARVLLATLQLEKGNVGGAFEQLKESLGMLPDSKSGEELGRESDTILQTIHTFIETSQVVASVMAPSLVHAPLNNLIADVPAQDNPAPLLVAQQAVLAPVESQTQTQAPAPAQTQVQAQVQAKTKLKSIQRSSKNSINKNVLAKSKVQATAPEPKIDEDEWTRKLRFLAQNGTSTLKNGEAFFFSEDSGEAILILADGKRIVRTVDSPKDREAIVQMRRPDILVPDDLLYNLSLLGKVVADKITSPLEAPGSLGDKQSESMNSFSSQATRQASDSLMQDKTPPSFKLESGRGDNLTDTLEPRRMVHWLKDVFHM